MYLITINKNGKLIGEFGLTQEQLAKEVNKTRASITHILAVNRLPEPIRKECAHAHISKSALIELAEVQLTEEGESPLKRTITADPPLSLWSDR
jgi:ParB-like chromosome segregation protein Spo0J